MGRIRFREAEQGGLKGEGRAKGQLDSAHAQVRTKENVLTFCGKLSLDSRRGRKDAAE